MKTKVRIVQQVNDSRSNYNHFYIQVLDLRYPDQKESQWLEVIGTISFQGNKGEDRWYGMNVEVNTSDASHLIKMGKLLAYVKENSYHDRQPEEVLQLIGAEHHMMDSRSSRFIPVSFIGLNCYKVIKNDSHYSTIYAVNDIQATKKLERLKLENSRFELDYVVKDCRN
jgi:hypothetical protein